METAQDLWKLFWLQLPVRALGFAALAASLAATCFFYEFSFQPLTVLLCLLPFLLFSECCLFPCSPCLLLYSFKSLHTRQSPQPCATATLSLLPHKSSLARKPAVPTPSHHLGADSGRA